jgi:hypothetical protein
MSRIIENPTQKMSDTGMQPLDIPDDDLAALTAYVSGLKVRSACHGATGRERAQRRQSDVRTSDHRERHSLHGEDRASLSS